MNRIVPLVLAGALATPAAADATRCAPHPETGLPLPDGRGTFCLNRDDPKSPVVVAADGGLVFLLPDATDGDDCLPNADGSCLYHRYDAAVRILFCPDVPGPAPRRHDTACLADVVSAAPGSSAFVGHGRMTVSALVRDARVTDCPASLYVEGDLSSPDGSAFRLSGGIVLARTRPDARATDAGCRLAHDDVRLSLARVAPDRAPAPARSAAAESELEALERLAALDPEQAALVDYLARLDEARWALLQQLLRADAAGVQTLLGAPESGVVEGSTVPRDDILNTDVVDQISDLIDDLSTNLSSLSSRVPSAPELRETFRQVELADLVRMLDLVREQIGALFDVVERLRQGYDTWVGNACDASSPCQAFRESLHELIADLREGARIAQLVACAEAPGLTIRPLETGLLEQLLIEDSPPIVLYGLARVLDAVAPADARSGETGWRQLIRQSLDALPVDFVHDLEAVCNNQPAALRNSEARQLGRSVESTGLLLCAVLRPPEVDAALKTGQGIGTFAHIATNVINHFTADTKGATLGAVAAAGATGGFSIKNVLNVITRLLKQIADKFGKPDESIFKQLMEMRDQCIEADDDIEEDLRDCKPRLATFLELGPAFIAPRPTLAEVKGVVQRGIRRANECKFFGGCADLDTDAAQTALDEADNHPPREAYPHLCEAYCELMGGDKCDVTDPVPGEGQGKGQGNGPGGKNGASSGLRRGS